MAKQVIDAKADMYRAKLEAGLIVKVPFSSEEHKALLIMVNEGKGLPEGILKGVDEYGIEAFYREVRFTERQMREYIELLQYEELKTIRKCVVFFTVLTVISLIGGVISCITLALNAM